MSHCHLEGQKTTLNQDLTVEASSRWWKHGNPRLTLIPTGNNKEQHALSNRLNHNCCITVQRRQEGLERSLQVKLPNVPVLVVVANLDENQESCQ